MRLLVLFSSGLLVHTAFAAVIGSLAAPTGVQRRGLDFLDSLNKDTTATHEHTLAGSDIAPTPTSDPEGSALKSFLGFPSSSEHASSGVSSAEPTPTKNRNKDASPTAAGGTSYSVIGSLPPLHTSSGTYSDVPPATPTSATSPAPMTTAVASASETSANSGTSEWKIIGVAVIAFTTVAGILLLSVFFDHWWRFLRDLVCRRRRKETEEELVPDWEKAEWHLRFGQDRQRYPSFSSLPSDAKVQPPPLAAPGPSRNSDTGRTLGRSLGSTADMAGYSPTSYLGANPNGIGLGLGRVDSVRRGTSSPTGSPAGQIPPASHGQPVCHGTAQNPFDDAHSPTPDDVYGGVVH